MDAATLASTLQLQTDRREYIYGFLLLAMKFGLLALGTASLIKLCFSYHQRLSRHAELAAILNVESAKLVDLQKRFDSLFTQGGEHRLIDEQDQWISPNSVRVIWR